MPRPEEIRVWVCDNCGNYFASSSVGDLSEEWNISKETKQPSFPRSRCPNRSCADRGILRTPVTVRLPPA